jgi:hypothetical protein
METPLGKACSATAGHRRADSGVSGSWARPAARVSPRARDDLLTCGWRPGVSGSSWPGGPVFTPDADHRSPGDLTERRRQAVPFYASGDRRHRRPDGIRAQSPTRQSESHPLARPAFRATACHPCCGSRSAQGRRAPHPGPNGSLAMNCDARPSAGTPGFATSAPVTGTAQGHRRRQPCLAACACHHSHARRFTLQRAGMDATASRSKGHGR